MGPFASALNVKAYKIKAVNKPLPFANSPIKFCLFPVHNREPLVLPAPLELKDPPGCRVCPEREEALAFLDPKETE